MDQGAPIDVVNLQLVVGQRRPSGVSSGLSRPRANILFDARWLDADGSRNVLGLARVGQEVIRLLPPLDRLEGGLRLFHPAEPAWLTAVLAKRRPQLFYSPGFNVPPTCPTPFVFTVFDLIHLHVAEESGAAKRLYYKVLVKPAARRARTVLTGSEYSRAEIIAWSGADPERVVVIGAAAAAQFTPDGDAHDPGYPYLLYVGNDKPHKNLKRLIAASSAVEHPSIRLLLVGPMTPRTRALIHAYGMHERVACLGRVPDKRLPKLYRGALALVFPSLYEGFGLPPLEAMACGTPVVSSTATSLAETVGGAAIEIDPLDTESIAHAIDRVVRDRELRATLRERGLKQARTLLVATDHGPHVASAATEPRRGPIVGTSLARNVSGQYAPRRLRATGTVIPRTRRSRPMERFSM